jgi:hypothetical protein
MEQHLARIRAARRSLDDATAAYHAAIADAVRHDVPVNQVAAVSGYHRNHVGRIARAHGVPDARHKPRRKPGGSSSVARQSRD